MALLRAEHGRGDPVLLPPPDRGDTGGARRGEDAGRSCLHDTTEAFRGVRGQCALLPVDFSPGSYLIGYQLDDTCWRRGYGTLACTFLVYFAFTVLDGYRLNGDTVADNTASRRVMEKCGFVQEGVQRRYWHARGGYFDRVIFGLLASDLAPTHLPELRDAFTAEALDRTVPGGGIASERPMHEER